MLDHIKKKCIYKREKMRSEKVRSLTFFSSKMSLKRMRTYRRTKEDMLSIDKVSFFN